VTDIRNIFIHLKGDETGVWQISSATNGGYERVVEPFEITSDHVDDVLAAIGNPAIIRHVGLVRQYAVHELADKIKRIEAQADELPALRARLADLT